MVDHSEDWAYDESFLWGNSFPQCSNLKQSPINIDTDNLKECRTMCNIKHRFKTTMCFVRYANKTITLRVTPGSYTEYQSTLYELREISIHTPSLHAIDGQKFDLEICLIHKLADNSSQNSGLMVCMMFERGNHYGKPEEFISQIINSIPSDPIDYDKEISVSDEWSASWLIPENSGYFSYNGSLPYPPCQEGYKVFVYEKIGFIGETNIEAFKRYLGNNARPLRPLGTRTIFYTPYLKNVHSEKKVYTSNNKYLKCYKERVVPAIDNSSETETTSSSSDTLQDGFSQDSKTRIKGILLSIIILLLIINSLYFVKFLYRHFYIQKMLRMFGGSANIKADTIRTWRNCQGTVITEVQKKLMKKAANNAELATNASATASGVSSMGLSSTSFEGFRQMTAPLTQSIGQQSTRGMQGTTTMPMSGQQGYGTTTYPRR